MRRLPASTNAKSAGWLFFLQKISMTREPAGPAFLKRSMRKTSIIKKTAPLLTAMKCTAKAATKDLDTSLTTARSQRDCAIASTQSIYALKSLIDFKRVIDSKRAFVI